MQYREFLPHPALVEVVECYWSIRSTEAIGEFHRIYPDGCTDIIFNTGDVLLARQGEKIEHNAARSFIVGNMNASFESGCNGKMDLTGIRFKPGGLSQFLRTPLHEFSDRSVPADLLPDDLCHFSTDRLAGLSEENRILLFNKILLTHRLEPGKAPWQKCLTLIKTTKGNCRIEHVAKEAGISIKHLERQFHNFVGISPKELSRVLRFREARERLQLSNYKNLFELAWDLGYTDHAHLTRSFKSFAGISPSDFIT